jgi:apolipoprotein N-acyltransferase
VSLSGDEAKEAPEEPAAPFWRRHRAPLLAAAGGAVASLATPPFDLFPLMFVGLGLLGLALRDISPERKRGFWPGFLYGLLWGTAGQLIVLRFVPAVIMRFTDLGAGLGYLALVLLSMGQSVHWALGLGLAGFLRKRLDAPPELALGAGVLLALTLPNIFVWSPAGLLSPWPVLVQLAEWIGERGVSVLIAIVGMLAVRAAWGFVRARGFHRPSAVRGGVALALIAVMLGHGAWAMRAHERGLTEGETARVGLVNAAVPPKYRWQAKNWPTILSRLRNLTADAETTGVDLTVWPEGAYPYPLPHGSLRGPRGKRQILGGSARGPVLFGFIARAPGFRRDDGTVERNSFNSATIIGDRRAMQPSYDKMELLWFGETVPLGEHLPWLRRAFQRSGGLVKGEELRGLTVERDDASPLRVGVFNCYEDTLPDFGREVMNTLQPNILVNVTNDAWFVGSEEADLHLRLSAMRAIELRRDLLRAVNMGVPAWIDATGRVRMRNDFPQPSFISVEASLRDGPPTLYARFGDWPMWILLGLGVAVARRWRSDRGEPMERERAGTDDGDPGAR